MAVSNNGGDGRQHEGRRPQPRFPHRGPVAAAAEPWADYDPIADWQATGALYCPRCHKRVHKVSDPGELPEHDCRPLARRPAAGVWG